MADYSQEDDHVKRTYEVRCPDCGMRIVNLEIHYYGRSLSPEFHIVCLDCGGVFELGDLPEKEV